MASSKINTRCGTIAIVGQPNVGKSTLLNYFVGSKLSITSRKAQTTRYQLVGIFTDKDTQYIFVDTPGYQLKHLNQMNKSLNKSVNQALKDVDLILFLSEPNELDATDKKILQMIPSSTPILLIINKIDLIKDKSKILALMSEADQLDKFEEIVPTSVKKKNNLLELLESVKKYLPQQPFIYDQDELTDKGERFLAGEIVREKLFRLTGQEVPYSVAVEIEKFEQEEI
jgi:GTP-binding protein Era